MGVIEQLKLYDFEGFKLDDRYPNAESYYMVLKEIPPNSKMHHLFKEKMDKELEFCEDNSRGTYYYTMIRYLALALEDLKNKGE